MRVAFYKGPPASALGQLSHWAVTTWTGSPYSHVEIVFRDIGLSSSARDGRVRAKRIDWDSGHWDLIDVPWADPAIVWGLYNRTRGAGYDWWGAARHALPWVRERGSRWYCSEWCAAALGLPCLQMTPGKLFDVLTGMEEG